LKENLVFALSLIAVQFAAVALAGEQNAKSDDVKAILARLKSHEVSLWDASLQIERLGPDAASAVEGQIDGFDTQQKMALARALCKMGSALRGVKVLAQVINDKPDAPAAREAAELLGKYGRSQAEGDLSSLLDKAKAIPLRIALAKSLWSAATTEESWEKANTTLRSIFKEAKGEDRKECAVALAEINDFGDDVVAVLDELQVEPSHRGGQAQALLDLRKLREMSRRNLQIDTSFKDPILHEISARLQTFHVEKPKTFEELRDAAAKGMASALDPFTNYYDAKEYREFRESMSGEYAGIGAKVGFLGDPTDPVDRIFCVIRPIYSGPAYRAGLRSYDTIAKINGEPTAGKELEKLVESLKGVPDTSVTISVTRYGQKDEKVLSIKRESIKMPSAYSKMLPGSLGYIKLLHFGNDSVQEFFAALGELEGKGMKGLIVDLRGNPGGLLDAAVKISGGFLKNDKLVVRSVGRDAKVVPEERYITTNVAAHPDYPMVVLVNAASASASEIVAGALQDYKRAVIIGERTYGKGSVQQLMELEADGRQSALKVTKAKYYLPSGRSIQRSSTERGGVKPDIDVKQESRIDSRDSGKFEEIRRAGSFDAYIEKYLAKNKQLFEQLADFDAADPSKYPGFNEWYDALTVHVSKETARLMLREWIRIKIGDEDGKEYFMDMQDDDQLARAIVEGMTMLGKKDEIEKTEQYKGFLKRFKLDK